MAVDAVFTAGQDCTLSTVISRLSSDVVTHHISYMAGELLQEIA